MRKAMLSVVLVLLCCSDCFCDENGWEDISAGNTGIIGVFAVPGTGIVCAATAQGSVIRSGDSGKDWQAVYSFEREPGGAAAFLFDPAGRRLYLAAGKGVYASVDTGKSWQRVLKRPYSCNGVEITPEGIVVATASGIFQSKDGRVWERVKEMDRKNVEGLVYCGKTRCLFAVADDGVYAVRCGCGFWQKIYASVRVPDESLAIEPEQEEQLPENVQARLLRVDAAGDLYAVLGSDFICSPDCGRSWRNISTGGLRRSRVTDIICEGRELIAASGSGVYWLEDDSWSERSQGLTGSTVNRLSADGNRIIFAACKRGVFRLKLFPDSPIAGISRQVTVEQVPSVRRLQEAAIAYAEVGNEKICEWRKSARRKAWLPQVSMGVNRNTGDLWHWESGSTTKEYDDQLRKGKDSVDWDIRMSWDLGELVWNNDQTSIDSRAKLMVELRNDILDQVTKMYFERERLEAELASSSDNGKRSQKQLRVRELEAGLDALTGGYFSRGQ